MFAIFQRLQNRQISTDRDETLTRQNFRPRYLRVLNLKALSQLLQTDSPAQSAWHLKKSLKSTIFKVLQNRQFSTD